jgi:hypothetical protein
MQDRLNVCAFQSFIMLRNKFPILLKPPKNARSDDCGHKCHIFQDCFSKDIYITACLPNCENIKSHNIRRDCQNVVRIRRRKLERISIVVKDKLIDN